MASHDWHSRIHSKRPKVRGRILQVKTGGATKSGDTNQLDTGQAGFADASGVQAGVEGLTRSPKPGSPVVLTCVNDAVIEHAG